MTLIVTSLLLFELKLIYYVFGQRACHKNVTTLGSCGGRSVSGDQLSIDFGIIEYQCSCKINFNFTGKVEYLLEAIDQKGCGRRIEIKYKDPTIEKQSKNCGGKLESLIVKPNGTSTVRLTSDPSRRSGNTRYCFTLLSPVDSYNFIVTCSLVYEGEDRTLKKPPTDGSPTERRLSVVFASLFGVAVIGMFLLTAVLLNVRRRWNKSDRKLGPDVGSAEQHNSTPPQIGSVYTELNLSVNYSELNGSYSALNDNRMFEDDMGYIVPINNH
ncbi:uncharacterized protein LOC133194793 [Saccostrea echinata]|uniref:uncharacterized protein LOC133194793 n=1 Tax=Saccostrea echinata TaxID=191078 RepID=UPI002A83AB8E|nr:uncharacterized protein LOC133194793 [Saccostrea echinata]